MPVSACLPEIPPAGGWPPLAKRPCRSIFTYWNAAQASGNSPSPATEPMRRAGTAPEHFSFETLLHAAAV